MNYNEFSQKIKTKYPEYKDIDDLELAQKMVAKYPEYKEQVSFDTEENQTQEKPKRIDLTPSGIVNNISGAVSDAIVTPLEMAKSGEKNPKKAYSTVAKRRKNFEKEYKKEAPILSGARDLGLDLLGYSMLPVARGKGIANFAKNAVVQGGVPMALESLKRGGNALGGLVGGSLLGAGIQSLPYVGKVAKLVPGAGKLISKTVGRVKPETIERAIKADSKALDLSEKEAQNLLMNTTEGVRNDYNSLLTNKGNVVGNLLEKLPADKTFKAGDILADYDKIYNNYSLSKNPALNPARNATTKELGKIEDLVYGDTSGDIQKFKQSLDDLKYPNGKLETIPRKYKNQYWTQSVDDVNNNITIANRRFNDEILGSLKEHPEWVNNPQKIEALENHIYNNYQVPEDYLNEMYNKLYEAVSKGNILDAANKKITPKELYDINKNVSNMVDWNKPDSALKNDVLEQIYGMNAEKISSLSPELQEANKAFSDLMDFQKNEGIRRILNNSNNIDAASSALRNYNSTVTKGNTNRNIQDLESLLVNNGYEPFLGNIDDVNAAMDLLNIRGTGDSWLANLATQATRPVLKAARAYNRSNLPNVITNIKETLSPLAQRLLTPLAVKSAAPLLSGKVEYNDY